MNPQATVSRPTLREIHLSVTSDKTWCWTAKAGPYVVGGSGFATRAEADADLRSRA